MFPTSTARPLCGLTAARAHASQMTSRLPAILPAGGPIRKHFLRESPNYPSWLLPVKLASEIPLLARPLSSA